MKDHILVAGVGNIFLGDDAFGVEVARAMVTRALPQGVVVRDFGIRSFDLAYALLDDWSAVVLVDAVSQHAPPGTLFVIEPDLSELSEESRNCNLRRSQHGSGDGPSIGTNSRRNSTARFSCSVANPPISAAMKVVWGFRRKSRAQSTKL